MIHSKLASILNRTAVSDLFFFFFGQSLKDLHQITYGWFSLKSGPWYQSLVLRFHRLFSTFFLLWTIPPTREVISFDRGHNYSEWPAGRFRRQFSIPVSPLGPSTPGFPLWPGAPVAPITPSKPRSPLGPWIPLSPFIPCPGSPLYPRGPAKPRSPLIPCFPCGPTLPVDEPKSNLEQVKARTLDPRYHFSPPHSQKTAPMSSCT